MQTIFDALDFLNLVILTMLAFKTAAARRRSEQLELAIGSTMASIRTQLKL